MTTALAHLAAGSGWFSLAVWGLCRSPLRLPAAARCTLWWVACLQIAVAVALALPRFQPEDRRGLVLWLVGWGLGFLVRLILLVLQGRLAGRLVREALPLPPCAAREMLTSLGNRLSLRRMPAVRVSSRLVSPVLAGLREPVLLLPVTAIQDTASPALQMAAAHELAHLRRRDLGLSLAPVLVQTILWWHPCVWLAVREYAVAREEACDAEARHVTGAAPDEYGAMLLDYLAPVERVDQFLRPAYSPYRSLLRRLTAMRIPYQQPRQGPVGAFCSVCILVTAAISAYPLLTPPSPSVTVAANPKHPSPTVRVASAIEVHPFSASGTSKPTVPVSHSVRRWVREMPVGPAVPPVRTHAAVPPAVAVREAERVVPAPARSARPAAHAHAVIAPRMETAVLPRATATIVVADDAVPAPVRAEAYPDLSQMRSNLQIWKKQLGGPQGMVLAPRFVCPPVLGKDFEQQIRSQFGPQSHRQWTQQERQIDEEVERELPAIRARAAQARRQAESAARDAARQQRDSERVAREAARGEMQALQAQDLADQARRDALKDLQKEFPQMQNELKNELAPVSPTTPLPQTDSTP